MTEMTPRRDEIQDWPWGSAAFEAFLTLDGVSTDDPRVTERFADCYVGSWAGWQHFADAITDSLGWKQALNEFTAANAIPDGVLRWDHAMLESHLREAYDIVDSGDWCHVFER